MSRLVVLGGGESGAGTAVLAQQKGYDVFLSDMGALKEEYKLLLSKYNIPYEEGNHTWEKILNADEIVKSPGIPDKAPLVKAALEKEIPIISELEFAARYTTAKLICITGSNGKTTTTSLIYHILKEAGLNVGLGGNIGKSFALQVALEQYDYYVLEISSFQLDGMYQFKADIAILCNITPDHLDRYDYKLENYAASKFRITQNMGPREHFIYCADDPITMQEMPKHKISAHCIPFSIEKTLKEGGYLEDQIIHTKPMEDIEMYIENLALKGKHNVYNSMAAAITAELLHIKKESIRKSLATFVNIEHRLEPVISVGGVLFINDSKATNVNSTWYALESMQNPTVWIVGGTDKGNDYSCLRELVRHKVKAIVCLGVDNRKIHEAFKDIVPIIVDTQSAEAAVQTSYKFAQKGDTVLLSPCCASFDLFKNYEDRGKQFKAAVRKL
jgi:UDP-N-acetylmuramoylalanine--D-glutamate ligase